MIHKPAVLAAVLRNQRLAFAAAGLLLGFAVGPTVGPALAQTPVYVPSMGSSATSRMPSTSSSGPRVYVPETGVSGRSQRSSKRIETAPVRPYRNRNATVPMPSSPYGGRIEVPDRVRPRETFQDRAARCNHYGTLYGAKNRAAYGNACINGN